MKYYRKTENEYGSYVDEAGIRFQVEWCSAVYSPTGQTPESLGYEPYESIEAAAEAWGLRHPQPEAEEAGEYPTEENLLTNNK